MTGGSINWDANKSGLNSSPIFVGGTAALAPSRRDDLASLGVRALLAATLATLMTGCIAGMFSGGEGVLIVGPG